MGWILQTSMIKWRRKTTPKKRCLHSALVVFIPHFHTMSFHKPAILYSYRVIQHLISLETNFSFWQCLRNWSVLDCFFSSRNSLRSLGNIPCPLKLKGLSKKKHISATKDWFTSHRQVSSPSHTTCPLALNSPLDLFAKGWWEVPCDQVCIVYTGTFLATWSI